MSIKKGTEIHQAIESMIDRIYTLTISSEINQNALNAAGWKFIDEHKKQLETPVSRALFNRIKPILKPVITAYIKEISK